jgi:hypothetical protein
VAVGSIPTESGRWDVEQFGRFVGVGADLAQKAGINLGPVAGFNFEAAFAKIASFAAAGALFSGPGAPIGAIIGAIVGVIVSLGGVWQQLQNPDWYQVGPGVQDWANNYAESAFIEECRAEGTDVWQTTEQIARHQLTWWLTKYGAVISHWVGAFYSGVPNGIYLTAAGDVRGLYQSAGVDWDKTREVRLAANNFSPVANVMMYDISVKTDGGETTMDPATPIKEGTGNDFAQGGEPVSSGVGLAAVGLLALVALSSQSKG